MGWREKLQPASFRGAKFHVRRHGAQVGRRLVKHEFPLRDLPYNEDLGRKARSYSIEAFVIGKDYLAPRDALLAACEEAGPGTLVHPYLGSMQVTCEGCREEESLEDGGYARFSLTFEEAGERRYPAATQDFAQQAGQAAANTRSVSGDVFAQVYRTVGPAWLAAAAAGDIKAALQLARAVVSVLPSPFDQAKLGPFLDQLDAAAAAAAASAAAGPSSAAELIAGALAGLGGLGSSGQTGGAVWAALEVGKFGAEPGSEEASAFGGTLDPVAATTANRKTQADNRAAVKALVRELAAAEGVDAALAADYASYQEAAAVRDKLLARLDELMLAAGHDTTPGADLRYEALRDLYVATHRAFVTLGADLAREVPYQVPNGVTPALALAYDLYGDLDRAEEIARRNRVRHPGALPPGETLQVLSV
ncbi:MAG: hypothetical protein C4525_03170 [Desulfarculus sp.]|nr:MAG: hypothetical protein C4525_03170 [Desulfarculus sp.]